MGRIMAGITAMVIVIFLAILIPDWYHTYRDVDAVIDRAQVAASAEDMLEYVEQLESNMKKIGMTSGYTALLIKTPANNMALHFRAIQKIIARLEKVKDLPQDQTAYQVALDDIRGTLRELPNPTRGWIWVHYIWWMIIVIVVLCVITFKSI